MMHTEDEAKKLWCPMVRFAQLEGNQTSSRGSFGGIPPEDFLCLASGCAMWRWGGAPRETVRAYHKAGGRRKYEDEQVGWQYEFTDIDGWGEKFDLMHRRALDETPRGYCGLAGKGDT